MLQQLVGGRESYARWERIALGGVDDLKFRPEVRDHGAQSEGYVRQGLCLEPDVPRPTAGLDPGVIAPPTTVEIEPDDLHVQSHVEPIGEASCGGHDTDMTPDADRSTDILLVVYEVLFTPVEQMARESQHAERLPGDSPRQRGRYTRERVSSHDQELALA